MAVGERVQSAAEVEWGDSDAILAIVDTPSVGEDVDVCALRTEFTVSLCSACQYAAVRSLYEYKVRRCPWGFAFAFDRKIGKVGSEKNGGPTFAKYLQTFSADAPRSWLKGHAAPA